MPARGLDHIVVGVRDLDAAGAFYQRLGFTVGARNEHPWGTHNRLIQFNGCFIELITVGDASLIPPHEPGRFSFGAFVRDALARGEGLSMVALESPDAARDNIAFRQVDIGYEAPFHFSRAGQRPDGSSVTVAFTLAFAHDDAAPNCGFFTCQQHNPAQFWNPALQNHPNGAKTIAAVTQVSRKPPAHTAFMRAFAGGGLSGKSEDAHAFVLPRSRLDIMTPGVVHKLFGVETSKAGFLGYSVAVSDILAMRQRLDMAKIRNAEVDGRLVISPRHGLGCMIMFERA
jgi:catechol 2,3-dioxygenase-like lactoylglutathione lyase family enzyme